MQVTTLLSRHDKALAEGEVNEQQLQQLQQKVSDQGSVLRAAKQAAKSDGSQESKQQVTICCKKLATWLCYWIVDLLSVLTLPGLWQSFFQVCSLSVMLLKQQLHCLSHESVSIHQRAISSEITVF